MLFVCIYVCDTQKSCKYASRSIVFIGTMVSNFLTTGSKRSCLKWDLDANECVPHRTNVITNGKLISPVEIGKLPEGKVAGITDFSYRVSKINFSPFVSGACSLSETHSYIFITNK